MSFAWKPGEMGAVNTSLEQARERHTGVSIMVRESDRGSDRGLELIMRPYKVWQYITTRTISYEEMITTHVTLDFLVTRSLQDMYAHLLEDLQAAGKTLEG